MRLDKFLCEMNIGTRSQVKDYIRAGQITVNDMIIKKADLKISESDDRICYQGRLLCYRPFVYYMLNKPRGVVSATTDNSSKTVIDLLSTEDKREDIFPAGRLDKDTEGFLLLTNDGGLSHRLLSPKHHVDKTYFVTIKHALDPRHISVLEHGVDIGEAKLTLPARVDVIDDFHILLTIQEGKFHQVKRMLQAVNNEVLALKRITFAGLTLDESLKPGEYRPLSEEEVQLLNET